MPRSEAPSITFQPSSEELEILIEYCQQEDRTRTDVLRQLLRELRGKIKKPIT